MAAATSPSKASAAEEVTRLAKSEHWCIMCSTMCYTKGVKMRKPTGIRFTDEEHAAIASYAAAHETSFSDVVRKAVREFTDPDRDKGYLTLAQIASTDSDVELAFGQFLDDFAHARDKAALIADEPRWPQEYTGRWRYDLAAAAHKLANDNGLPVPAWCIEERYCPDEPLWAFDTEDPQFRSYLRENTPREFRWHNLFLGPNVLQRA